MFKQFCVLFLCIFAFLLPKSASAFGITPPENNVLNQHYQEKSTHSFIVSAWEFVEGSVEFRVTGELADHISFAKDHFDIPTQEYAVQEVFYTIDPDGLEVGKTYEGVIYVLGVGSHNGTRLTLELLHKVEVDIIEEADKHVEIHSTASVKKEGEYLTLGVGVKNKGNTTRTVKEISLLYNKNGKTKELEIDDTVFEVAPYTVEELNIAVPIDLLQEKIDRFGSMSIQVLFEDKEKETLSIYISNDFFVVDSLAQQKEVKSSKKWYIKFVDSIRTFFSELF
ncbi:hypothetical protein KKG22_00060 [Patescibacteria group bacterium]|nr:hypothetical protein [Patescibacteria group bacterium]MBU1722071.1 hypothetical protein [Patescibacteria group bacterium]MBU1901351.1 hypothetical protein [Patescibacteria group bacterium]